MTRPDASPPPRANDSGRRLGFTFSRALPYALPDALPHTLARALAPALALLAFGWAISASANPEAAAAPPEPASVSAPAPAPPVSLSNADVGKSAEQVEASHAPSPEVSPTVAAPAGAPSELQSTADQLAAVADEKKRISEELVRHAHDTSRALKAAEAGDIPGVGANEDGPATYESCVEATIRRGDAFSSADRLCRVIYPSAADLGKHAPRDDLD